MKRKILLGGFIVFFFLCMFTIERKSQITKTVFQEEQAQKGYVLNVSKEDFTNFNMRKILDSYEIEIRRVYPLNSLIVEDEKIEQELLKFYYYSDKSLEQQYQKILKKYGFYQDLEQTQVQGFKIKGLVVRTTKENIIKLKQDYPKIKILDSEEELKERNN